MAPHSRAQLASPQRHHLDEGAPGSRARVEHTGPFFTASLSIARETVPQSRGNRNETGNTSPAAGPLHPSGAGSAHSLGPGIAAFC